MKVCLALTLAGGAALAQNTDWNALGKLWWSHVQFLADDSLEGRGTGSRGFEKAADLHGRAISRRGFRARRRRWLSPADGLPGGDRLTKLAALSICLRDGKVQPVKLGDDAVLGVSSHAAENVEAGAVFVGYGLTVPELHYDDLAGQDVKGKIVVFVTGGPADMPGPVKAHYQSGEERRKALAKAGVIGTISIPNPKSAEVPWSRIAASRFQPRMELSDPGQGRPASTPRGHPIQSRTSRNALRRERSHLSGDSCGRSTQISHCHTFLWR